ncbi:MAG: hypothetical protein JW760_00585 [Spirochaetales bacterium]|nr:hypothetical protein [Spirochaetales bacterium]
MNLYLFLIPGALFLLVIFFRVVLPYLKNPRWKRLLDSARYERSREHEEKSDELLEKAILRFPQQPQVYIEYFLNHTDAGNIQRRVEILLQGYEETQDTALAFFLGNAYLEHGEFSTAGQYLNTPQCREYMVEHRIPLYAQLLYEEGHYEEAEKDFLDFYRRVFPSTDTQENVLDDLSAQELSLYVLILKAGGKDWRSVMDRVPKTSVHSDMGWKDYLSLLQDEQRKLKPAVTGINGDPAVFNRRRASYFSERIKLVQQYL